MYNGSNRCVGYAFSSYADPDSNYVSAYLSSHFHLRITSLNRKKNYKAKNPSQKTGKPLIGNSLIVPTPLLTTLLCWVAYYLLEIYVRDISSFYLIICKVACED